MAKKDVGDEKGKSQPIIVKKVIKGGGGHHGGAWKVAYADFVTAMMAFFLLLWLLNVTTEEQKTAISTYFDPTLPKISSSESGAGGVLGGISVSPEGAMTTNLQPPVAAVDAPKEQARPDQTLKSAEELAEEELQQELARREEARFEQVKQELEKAIQENPELKELAKNLLVDVTPEGLRIQIVDQEGEPMFPLGSARMFEKTEKLMGLVSRAVGKLPNHISIRGHTDSKPYSAGGNYSNWELSADRANASRRVLLNNGMKQERIGNVMGKADTEPLIEKFPTDARNRRITIILLRESLKSQSTDGAAAVQKAQDEGFQRSQGRVQFP